MLALFLHFELVKEDGSALGVNGVGWNITSGIVCAYQRKGVLKNINDSLSNDKFQNK